jgi:DNA-binding transcriptional ArsR family regulator
MADLLPSRPDTAAAEETDPRVVGLDDEDADDLLSALSSETSREVLGALHDEPDNPSAIADRVDTSLQNAQYHLDNLEDADLIEPIDTVYSEKGREMTVYAPADRPLVIFAGPDEEREGIRGALRSLLGALGVLSLASLIAQWQLGDLPFVGQAGAGGDATGGGDGGGVSTMDVETASAGADAGAGVGAGLPPGLLVFLGGLVAIAVVGAVWYVRRRHRP